ncbi:Menaquinone via futalosine step 2 [Enhygromyxa salina]|uniref:Futalosine hydrolase n=1 Tax=Enhygromyxa salina TaxID=215803 RepID=A0A0C1Z8F9_9BACT|nr:futalosine hydrolase [Enhygromyxa salina]KIG13914.1 Menaquinone via futalosine step 2 [Enhygromyxa salina]
MSTLLAYAAAREGASLPNTRHPTLQLGVGKIAATMSLTAALTKQRPDAVLLFGVGGAYPARHLRRGLDAMELLDACVVVTEFIADDGVLTPSGFLDLGHLDLGDVGPIPCDPELSGKLSAVLGCPLVAGATVSTGAGVDPISQAYALRSGAQIETMEGAAVAAVCRHFEVPVAQLRIVSNRTGDRDQGGWDLDGAVARLGQVLERVLAADVLP